MNRLFTGVDTDDMESLRSQKVEIESDISSIEESLKILLAEQRQLEDDAAKLHRQRVCFFFK